MKYKIGDKVKFLNEVGGGVVQKIISPTMVSVTNQDGFDIPVMINEIIFAESNEPVEKVFNQDFAPVETDNYPSLQSALPSKEEEASRSVKLQRFSSLNKNAFGIYLGYVPQDQVWLVKDAIDLYVINYTDFEVVYNLAMEEEDGKVSGIDYGSVAAFSKVHIAIIERNELEKWLKGCVQALFFKESDSQIRLPLHAPFEVKLPQFFEKEHYTTSSFLAEKGIFVFLRKRIYQSNTEQK